MNPLTTDMKNKMVALGLGVDGVLTPAADWSIHERAYPTKPPRIIAVYRTDNDHQHILGTRRSYETLRFQVRVRGVTPIEAEAKADAIHEGLERVGRFIVQPISPNTVRMLYLDILLINGPIDMGRDENDRPSFVLNFKTFREEHTPST